MATKYTIGTSISATGLASLPLETHSKSGSMSGDSDIIDDTQDIGTSSEKITLGEIAAGGAELVEIVNLDLTNFVSIGFANPVVAGTLTYKIKAGQSQVMCTPSTDLYAIADTATVKILKRAVEA